jgi:hypothetical protein
MLIPFLHEQLLVRADHCKQIVQFLLRATFVSGDRDALQPDLGFLAILADMYVRGFMSVQTVELKASSFPLEHARHRLRPLKRHRVVFLPRLVLPLGSQHGEGAGDALAA